MATALLAAWVGKSSTFTSSTVVKPPRPWAPTPSSFTLSYILRRKRSTLSSSAPLWALACKSWISMCSMSERLASIMAFSGVPPTPIPKIPGGHQPAPICGTVFNTHSSIESEGFSIANFALFSEPPPFAAQITSTLSPGTTLM